MSSTELKPQSESKATLEYVRASAPVTRRQFRGLFILTLLNTILLATFICGPVVSQLARSTWQQYQTRQRIRKQQQAQDALFQQAAQFTAPADQVVYEENPTDAAALLKTSNATSTVPAAYLPIVRTRVPWQVPVALADTPLVARLRAALPPSNEVYGTLLLHNLKKKTGQERLVWVFVRGEQQNMGVRNFFTPDDLTHPLRQLTFKTRRMITAVTVQADTSFPTPVISTTARGDLYPDMLDMESTVTWKRTDTSASEDPVIEAKGLLRFYAAQLDPADPSHFTIDYVYRGDRNTIDVHMEDDDTIVFKPRGGTIANDPPNDPSHRQIWYPFSPPGTRPSR